MPRKKLTKAQVKRKLKAIMKTTADLISDRMNHPDSVVPFTPAKLFDMSTVANNAFKRIK